MLENYNKVKGEQKAAKKALNFAPAAKKEPTCAYCKKTGHWIKDNKTGKTTCPKLVGRNAYNLKRNGEAVAARKSWQDQTSAKVEESYGAGGGSWQTTGSQDRTAGKVEYKRAIVKVTNAYDFGDDEWNEIGAAKAREDELAEQAVAEAEEFAAAAAAEAEKAAVEAAAAMGRWNKPLSQRGVKEEAVKEESVDEAIKCPGCEDWGCPDCN